MQNNDFVHLHDIGTLSAHDLVHLQIRLVYAELSTINFDFASSTSIEPPSDQSHQPLHQHRFWLAPAPLPRVAEGQRLSPHVVGTHVPPTGSLLPFTNDARQIAHHWKDSHRQKLASQPESSLKFETSAKGNHKRSKCAQPTLFSTWPPSCASDRDFKFTVHILPLPDQPLSPPVRLRFLTD